MKTDDMLDERTSSEYQAPEIVESKPSTIQVDMWALGIMLYQFVSSWQKPFGC